MSDLDFCVNFNVPEEKKNYIESLDSLHGTYIIHAKKKSKQRSLRINAYYWSVIIGYIHEETHQPPLDIHEHIKKTWLWMVKWGKNQYDLTTTDLSNEEMWLLITFVRNWADREFFVKKGKIGGLPDPYSVLR